MDFICTQRKELELLVVSSSRVQMEMREKTDISVSCAFNRRLYLFPILYTAVSRKVVGKKRTRHATIPKGNLGNDQQGTFLTL